MSSASMFESEMFTVQCISVRGGVVLQIVLVT